MKHFFQHPNKEWSKGYPFPMLLFLYAIGKFDDETLIWNRDVCLGDAQSPQKCSHLDRCEKFKDLNPFSKFLTKYLYGRLGIITISIALSIKLVSLSFTLIDNLTINIWTYENVHGTANGKEASFRIAIITQEYRWKLAQVDQLESGMLDEKLPKYLDKLSDFDHAIGLIPVGVASHEFNSLETEVQRADKRADNIMLLLRENRLAPGKGLYKLNLGKYQIDTSDTDDDTSYQRRVILIGIMQMNRSMTVDETKAALKDALQKAQRLSIDIANYSNFDFVQLREPDF